MLEIYKRGQGKYTRVTTVVGVMLVGVIGAWVLSGRLAAWLGSGSYMTLLSFGIPVVVVAVLGGLMFWLVNRPSSADFLIATESEMKKVSWSSRKEIVGSTKVVIVTTFMVAGILYGVDILFTALFRSMGVGI